MLNQSGPPMYWRTYYNHNPGLEPIEQLHVNQPCAWYIVVLDCDARTIGMVMGRRFDGFFQNFLSWLPPWCQEDLPMSRGAVRTKASWHFPTRVRFQRQVRTSQWKLCVWMCLVWCSSFPNKTIDGKRWHPCVCECERFMGSVECSDPIS
jgi:hypothetical protein